MPSVSICARMFAILAGGLVAACASAPFSYSEDRCRGSYNQCRNACKDMPSGGASAACYDRCLASERRCYATGEVDGAGSSLAQESLIGRSRSEAEKEADYERWKAEKERERKETDAAELDD